MLELKPSDLQLFVTESNRIEGILRKPTTAEIAAHFDLLNIAHALTMSDLEAFVKIVAPGKLLRRESGMNVRVGDHIAPPGSMRIVEYLGDIIDDVNRGRDPYAVHCRYETLHPFMDGNGRSGRALWLWQMLNQQDALYVLRVGFLHVWYYQTLSHSER